ncbi:MULTISPECIES: nucleotide exchange factor GrpE [unclassified Saccharopolyspora]|uniref:nucleotide exchange factor GrpE n=1 Tax=unclassified Saccharopolyspora TaxID=2646250 RepID=UPI001CD25882|nr:MULTISPECIES: nucleotide exchange factor GrpE [unclassified Saccharopolyspora]MCA1188762.1 nucleotide exchange factor GrpE [Saccharopolyspora sp. 6T]MCA1194487.1 nucleotide exchange factor GrpE [Saccharopolyspora sp. 6V]MCA1226681.1 nucleotide exchange factor GrpE [Saccharopolyspora sp. 6M]MCA1278976.1 nucleotide exchange factor GrpE [Saccharopolyspora sp. 7B]
MTTSPHEHDTESDEQAQQAEQPEEAEAVRPNAAELEDRLRRALADLDNARKRHVRELGLVRAEERAKATAAWLPVLDNLELALEHAEADPESIVDGVRAVRDQAVDLLARLGYPRQEEVGVPFDPSRHEVVDVVSDSDAEPGIVVGVRRPGYGEPDNQLRPTAVSVTRQSG